MGGLGPSGSRLHKQHLPAGFINGTIHVRFYGLPDQTPCVMSRAGMEPHAHARPKPSHTQHRPSIPPSLRQQLRDSLNTNIFLKSERKLPFKASISSSLRKRQLLVRRTQPPFKPTAMNSAFTQACAVNRGKQIAAGPTKPVNAFSRLASTTRFNKTYVRFLKVSC